MFKNYINEYDLIKNLQELIRIPSIHEESNNPDEPFGKNTVNALEYALNLGKKLGFKTKNIDGYCGYIEFGEGDEILGIIGHLDVVPGGDGWTKCLPFEPIIENNKIYGRGAIDDKGPVIAALYAMKYVMDTIHINKRVRLILGLNEEASWKCIEYYKKHEELPTIGFSPDADFPVIYAEKGFLNAFVESQIINDSNIKLKSLICDNAINIVPKHAECILELYDIDIDELKNKLSNIITENNFHIEIETLDNNQLKIISTGVAAHAAHPDLGVNALSRLLILLDKIFTAYNINHPIFNYIDSKINTTLNGKLLNIDCNDESGNLTLNIGNLKYENNILKIGLNIRIPVTIYSSIIKQKIADSILDFTDISVYFADEKPALYVPKNDPLVTTLCDIFNEVTGKNCEPITCSGATYARAFKNVVSFGCNMPGHIDLCHQADEYIDIDTLFKSIEIYIKAIWKLS